jgi:DNA-binding LacI/PurR family transcriptional regulator
LSAPENLSIIDIDDHQLSWLPGLTTGLSTGLTTIAQPVADPGAFAAKLLIEDSTAQDLPIPAGHVLVTKLVERMSTRRRR